MNNRLRTALIVLISLVWAVNFTAPLYIKGFKPPSEINIAFMGIVGLLTAGYKQNGSSNTTSQVPDTQPEPEPEVEPEPIVTPRKRAPTKKTPAKKVSAKKAVKKAPVKKVAKKPTKKQPAKKQTRRKR